MIRNCLLNQAHRFNYPFLRFIMTNDFMMNQIPLSPNVLNRWLRVSWTKVGYFYHLEMGHAFAWVNWVQWLRSVFLSKQFSFHFSLQRKRLEVVYWLFLSFLGQKFALYQIKLALLEIVRHYLITVNSKTTEPITASSLDSLLTPISPIYLDFQRIKNETNWKISEKK